MNSAPREGSRVSFVGDEFNGERLTVGDEGRVLSHGGSACHVIWHTGERAGQITLTANHELLSRDGAEAVQDGHIVSTSVRDAYDRQGNRGLLQVLASEGALGSLASAAEEALAFVTSRIRGDTYVQEVLASLDADEADGFVSYTALALLREAFGE